MAGINKNFKVQNGLEVSQNLIIADATKNVVGIATSTPNHTLHVNGGIGATSLNVTGVTTTLEIKGRDLNFTGVGTIGNLSIASGIVSATTGVITYYGDGSKLINVAGGANTNILYVSKDGSDSNPGTTLNQAKATIKAAVGVASEGTVIKISAGTYIEDNPITLPAQVSLVGDSLREVSIGCSNYGDLFYVSNGNYIWNLSFVGAANTAAIFSFNPNVATYINQSPYIQNCTNFIPRSIGLRIDGSKAIGPTKSMVLDSYTQYNQGGIGCSITNEGYAQLVSMFTICNEIAVYCGSGGACDLTNSNSSFGEYALVADGVGPRKYTGIVTSAAAANSDTFTLSFNSPLLTVTNATYDNISGIATVTVNNPHNLSVGMAVTMAGLGFTCLGNPGAGINLYPSGNSGNTFEVRSVPSSTSFSVNVGPSTTPGQVYSSGGTVYHKIVRPFDGQVVYFDNLYYTIEKINLTDGGSGYLSRPTVTIDAPTTSWGVPATAVANINNTGSVTSIEIVSSGRGYTTTPNVTISAPNVGIATATATAAPLQTYYVIKSSTPVTSAGICTITLSDNVPYAVGVGTTVPFFKQSRILASGHSLEYIGSGVTIATALPATGGVPIQENETDARNGGLVVFTSTDQSGNFRMGDGVIINQQTGSISGKFYSKSLFSTMTPFILALGGN
jgi:hypothetical protein